MPKQVLLAAPLTGLFLILTVVAVLSSATPQGLTVEMVYWGDCDLDKVVDRSIVLHVKADGSVALNLTTVPISDLGGRLNKIYRTRGEKVIFVKADENVPFQSVAEVISVARKHVDYVALITPSLDHEWQERSCHLTYPTIHRPPPIMPDIRGESAQWMD